MVSQDPYMAEVFPLPPLTAYKRQKNIKDFIIKAKVIQNKRNNKRYIKGMKKCGKSCGACPYIQEGNLIKCEKFTWKISKPINCESKNTVYMIQCTKERCNKNYIGETNRALKQRFLEHKRYVDNKITTQATGEHFNLPGHSRNNMKITIIEQVKKQDQSYRKEREKYFIKKFNPVYQGINKQP